MKEFLKKFLSEEQMKVVEDAYKAANPDSKGLPVYISKSRLDEVLTKQHAAESEKDALTKQLEDYKSGMQKQIDDAVKVAMDNAKVEQEKALKDQKNEFDITEAIYKAQGRNVTAIKSLIDRKAPIADEIKRLQKEEPYLFVKSSDSIPEGTGKNGSDEASKTTKELEAMRRAVGL